MDSRMATSAGEQWRHRLAQVSLGGDVLMTSPARATAAVLERAAVLHPPVDPALLTSTPGAPEDWCWEQLRERDTTLAFVTQQYTRQLSDTRNLVNAITAAKAEVRRSSQKERGKAEKLLRKELPSNGDYQLLLREKRPPRAGTLTCGQGHVDDPVNGEPHRDTRLRGTRTRRRGRGEKAHSQEQQYKAPSPSISPPPPLRIEPSPSSPPASLSRTVPQSRPTSNAAWMAEGWAECLLSAERTQRRYIAAEEGLRRQAATAGLRHTMLKCERVALQPPFSQPRLPEPIELNTTVDTAAPNPGTPNPSPAARKEMITNAAWAPVPSSQPSRTSPQPPEYEGLPQQWHKPANGWGSASGSVADSGEGRQEEEVEPRERDDGAADGAIQRMIEAETQLRSERAEALQRMESLLRSAQQRAEAAEQRAADADRRAAGFEAQARTAEDREAEAQQRVEELRRRCDEESAALRSSQQCVEAAEQRTVDASTKLSDAERRAADFIRRTRVAEVSAAEAQGRLQSLDAQWRRMVDSLCRRQQNELQESEDRFRTYVRWSEGNVRALFSEWQQNKPLLVPLCRGDAKPSTAGQSVGESARPSIEFPAPSPEVATAPTAPISLAPSEEPPAAAPAAALAAAPPAAPPGTPPSASTGVRGRTRGEWRRRRNQVPRESSVDSTDTGSGRARSGSGRGSAPSASSGSATSSRRESGANAAVGRHAAVLVAAERAGPAAAAAAESCRRELERTLRSMRAADSCPTSLRNYMRAVRRDAALQNTRAQDP